MVILHQNDVVLVVSITTSVYFAVTIAFLERETYHLLTWRLLVSFGVSVVIADQLELVSSRVDSTRFLLSFTFWVNYTFVPLHFFKDFTLHYAYSIIPVDLLPFRSSVNGVLFALLNIRWMTEWHLDTWLKVQEMNNIVEK